MTAEDEYTLLVKLNRVDLARLMVHSWLRSKLIWGLTLLLVVILHWLLREYSFRIDDYYGLPFGTSIWIISTCAVLFVFFCLGLRMVVQILFYTDPLILEETTYELSRSGLNVVRAGLRNEVNWDRIRRVHCTRGYCYLFLTQLSAFVIPRRCLTFGLNWDEFCSFCKGQFQLAKAHAEQ